ncbi:GumC family protein [Pacificibacter marinus]|uniref:non-specific protein-tyrosine kinase n=1 Tax=Pacificibacter marinus TaxID=658057 RepID=A0A1Y5TAZ7_9RHOB|nr:polysaccharide biosynthesis tyrosine autokinase [Pacificibacter marinus]SEL10292.1 capsular exopolysaccharide family [Pacificibacter marinus]SLN59949.1 Tyrosine-protein kinase etk [Pacificibacter marinus]
MTETETVDIRGILSMLRRQMRLILISVVIVIGLALMYLFNATSIYTSQALIYVDPSKKDLLSVEQFASGSSSADNSKIDSEVEILRSNRVLFETMNLMGLIKDDEFGPQLSRIDHIKLAVGIEVESPNDPKVLVASTSQKLRNSVDIRRKGLTYLITVSANSENPEKAAEIANTMAEVYIRQQIASKVESALASRDVLQAQIDTARSGLAQSEASFNTFITDNLTRLEAEVGTERFTELQSQLESVRTETLQTQTQIASARTALDEMNWDTLLETLSSDALSALERQRVALEQRLQGTPEGSDEEINLRAGLLTIQTNMEQQAQAAFGSLEQSLALKEDSLDELQGSLRNEVLKGDLSPDTLASIFSLQQESDISQRQYSNLLSRMRDLEAQAMVQVADSRLVSEALPPNFPSAPNRKMILALAMVLATGIGVGLAFINEFLVGGITSLSQLRNIITTGVVIGSVPKVVLTDTQLGVGDLVIDEPMSSFSESLRRIRANIDQELRDTVDGCAIIMVTSANSNEGKSSLSLSLARTYANAGKNVLLIDGDLRKPSQHKLLGVQPNEGFLDYLSNPGGDSDIDRSFYITDSKSRAGVILGRGQADVPTDQLLQTETFLNLMKSARKNMDIIIIDTPPMLPVVDARYIAQHADAIIMAVRYGMTSQSDVREGFVQLEAAKRSKVSIYTVLNCDETKATDNAYYSYNE